VFQLTAAINCDWFPEHWRVNYLAHMWCSVWGSGWASVGLLLRGTEDISVVTEIYWRMSALQFKTYPKKVRKEKKVKRKKYRKIGWKIAGNCEAPKLWRLHPSGMRRCVVRRAVTMAAGRLALKLRALHSSKVDKRPRTALPHIAQTGTFSNTAVINPKYRSPINISL